MVLNVKSVAVRGTFGVILLCVLYLSLRGAVSRSGGGGAAARIQKQEAHWPDSLLPASNMRRIKMAVTRSTTGS